MILRKDLIVAITAFLAIMLFIAVMGYIGYERWSDIPP